MLFWKYSLFCKGRRQIDITIFIFKLISKGTAWMELYKFPQKPRILPLLLHISKRYHCVKNVQIRSYFWSVFSWTEYRKIRTRNNSVFRHFWPSVWRLISVKTNWAAKRKDILIYLNWGKITYSKCSANLIILFKIINI